MNAKDLLVYNESCDDRPHCTALLTPIVEKTCKFDSEVIALDDSRDDLMDSGMIESNVDEEKKSPKNVSFKKGNVNGEKGFSRMNRMKQSFTKFRKNSSLKNSIGRYRRSLKVITSRVVQADKTWVGCMIAMSTIDIFINLANFVQMSDDNLNYGLVIGPPSRVLWYTLLVFTCVSWLLFVPETLNSLSVLYSPNRETYFPIAVEMTLTLLLKHIPLSTVVYFVGRCRREYTTSLESVCNGFRIVHILGRLVWYAHLEGRKLKRNDKHAIQKSFVLLSLLLFGVATSFVIKNWRNEPDTRLKRYHLVNVSIVMLSEPHVNEVMGERFPPEVKSFKLELSQLIRRHGYNVERPFLVKSILVVKQRGFLTRDFVCHSRNGYQDMKPFECDQETTFLRFHFLFHEPTLTSPYGEIRYNFAKLQQSSTSNSTSSLESVDKNRNDTKTEYKCTETDEEPKKRWKLYYLEVTKYHSNLTYETGIRVTVSSPFRKTWTHPRPRYDESIAVCRGGKAMHNLKQYPLRAIRAPSSLRRLVVRKNYPPETFAKLPDIFE